jgi:hypothetical protein
VPVVAQWPWLAETSAFALLVSGCLVAVGVVVGMRTRAADPTELRVSS